MKQKMNASLAPFKAKQIFAAVRGLILAGLIGCFAFGARAAVQVTQFDPPLQISAYANPPANSYFNVLGTDLDANGEVDFRLAYGLGGIDAYFNAPVRFGQHVSQLNGVGNVVQRDGPVGGVPLGSMIGRNIASSVAANFYVWSSGCTNDYDLTQPFGDHEAPVISAVFVATYNLPGPVVSTSHDGILVTNIIYPHPQPVVSGDIEGQDAVIALEFVVNGQTHYGYIHCNFTNGASGVVYGWAYETDADTAIEAASLAPSPVPPTEAPVKGHSGIVGWVNMVGLTGWTVSIASPDGKFLKSVTTDADGYFKVNLARGTYVLTPFFVPHPGPGQPVPNFVASGPPKTVKVSRNHFAFVVLNPSLGALPVSPNP
jgi:hypothetical protein